MWTQHRVHSGTRRGVSVSSGASLLTTHITVATFSTAKARTTQLFLRRLVHVFCLHGLPLFIAITAACATRVGHGVPYLNGQNPFALR